MTTSATVYASPSEPVVDRVAVTQWNLHYPRNTHNRKREREPEGANRLYSDVFAMASRSGITTPLALQGGGTVCPVSSITNARIAHLVASKSCDAQAAGRIARSTCPHTSRTETSTKQISR